MILFGEKFFCFQVLEMVHAIGLWPLVSKNTHLIQKVVQVGNKHKQTRKEKTNFIFPLFFKKFIFN